MYAPKDDYKHRASWRELYSVEEAGMPGLVLAITTALNNLDYIFCIYFVDFYYFKSKGLKGSVYTFN
jgi:hypothetical protein